MLVSDLLSLGNQYFVDFLMTGNAGHRQMQVAERGTVDVFLFGKFDHLLGG